MATSTKEGMTLFQHYIYKSRYSRWLQDENRRETWPETVKRYFDFFDDHLKTSFNHDIKPYRAELEDAVLSFKVMPSMRCLMVAGEALKRENVAGYNCLAAETLITTKEHGHVPIGGLFGKPVSVINSDGEWSETVVKSYGERPLHKVSFRYGTSRFMDDIYATDNHDWVVSDGRRLKTSELKKGMVIPTILRRRNDYGDSNDYRLGVMHGVIYGDGTKLNKTNSNKNKITSACKRDKGYIIRICSDQEDTLKLFEGYEVSYPKTYNGDPVVYLYDEFASTHRLKELPDTDESEAYLVGFFRGWLAADGSVSLNGQVTMCVGPEEEEWLRKTMPVFGIHFGSSYSLPKTTNLGERNKPSRTLFVWRPSLVADDIILERKRKNFKPITAERKVYSVMQTNRVEEVFCVEVPKYKSFVVGNGILTGNCSYIPIDSQRSFDEILYIIMCGTGVGFSVESRYTEQLPRIADDFYESDTTIIVADSRLGWAKGLKELIHLLYSGQIPKWDTSKIRAAGSPLKTFGGRSSGPQAIEEVFKFAVALFKRAAGRKLTTIECHDLVCKIAESIVVGGVRRSALISISDLSDDRMRYAKSGQWWIENEQRTLANNSAGYNEKPDVGIFMDEWKALYDSKSGERGIFNRQSARRHIDAMGRRDSDHYFGTNPCVVGDTEIDTNFGKMRIRDVVNLFTAGRRDILVKSYSNKVEFRQISAAALTKTNTEVIELEVTTSLGTITKLILTPDHLVFTENRGYVEAEDLTEDDELVVSV